jgi:hypothetical protein
MSFCAWLQFELFMESILFDLWSFDQSQFDLWWNFLVMIGINVELWVYSLHSWCWQEAWTRLLIVAFSRKQLCACSLHQASGLLAILVHLLLGNIFHKLIDLFHEFLLGFLVYTPNRWLSVPCTLSRPEIGQRISICWLQNQILNRPSAFNYVLYCLKLSMCINSWGMYNITVQCASKCVFMLTIF